MANSRQRLIGIVVLLILCVPAWVVAQSGLISGSRTLAGGLNYCGATGGAENAYTCTLDPPLTIQLPTGACVSMLITAANTGAATLAVNGQTAVPLVKRVGGVSQALVTGDLGTGQFATACFDGTSAQLVSLGDSAAVAKLAGGGGQEITGTGVTPRRAAITLTDGVAAVPGPASADIVYQHAMVAGTGGDVHFNAPSGATTDGQRLIFELLSAQAQQVPVSWDADAYCWNGGIAQPTHTSGTNVSKVYDYWQFLRNPTAGAGGTPCWVLVAIASSTEALEPGTLIISEAGGSSAAYGAFSVPLGSMDLTGAINGSAGTPHLTYVQPSPPARQTLLNTRVRQEVATVTTTASLDPDCQLYEQYSITELAENITINIPGNGTANCTPTDGQYLVFLFRNATEVATYTITWITSAGGYSDEHFIALPTSTLLNKVLAVQFRWSVTTSKWGLIGSSPVGSALVNPMDAPGEMIYGGVAGAVTALSSGTGLLHNDGAGVLSWSGVVEGDLSFTDVLTGNASTGQHGLLRKLSGNAAEVLKGDGTWGTDAVGAATPGGSDGQGQYRVNASTFGGSPGLTLDADGITGERRKCITVTADPAPMTARCYFVDTTAGNVTLTLPPASMTNGAADIFDVYKVTNDANQLILNADTGDLLNFVDQDLTETGRGVGFHIEEQSGAATGNWIVLRAVTSVTASMLTFTATDRLLGRDTAGAGVGEEIGVTAPLSISGGNLQVAAATLTAAGIAEFATVPEATTGSSEGLAVTPLGLTTHSRVRSIYIPAGAMEPSGGCVMNAAAILVTNGPKLPTITCTDADADSIEFDWVSPDGWNAGTITVELVAFSIGNNSTEVFAMHFAGQCVSDGDTPTAHATTGEQIATITWGNAANREQHATTGTPITLQGTCAAGDHIYMRGQIDQGTTNTNPMTDVKILGVKVEYTRNAND